MTCLMLGNPLQAIHTRFQSAVNNVKPGAVVSKSEHLKTGEYRQRKARLTDVTFLGAVKHH